MGYVYFEINFEFVYGGVSMERFAFYYDETEHSRVINSRTSQLKTITMVLLRR